MMAEGNVRRGRVGYRGIGLEFKREGMVFELFAAGKKVMEVMIEMKNEVRDGVRQMWWITGTKEDGVGKRKEVVEAAYLGEVSKDCGTRNDMLRSMVRKVEVE